MQVETIQAADLTRAEARLPRWMMAWALVGTLVVLCSWHARDAIGFALGAAVAILNYFWLHEAIETLFGARRPRLPRMVVVKLAIRYPLALAGVYFFYRTGWLPFLAILAGLFVAVAGVLTEAVVQIFAGLSVVRSQ